MKTIENNLVNDHIMPMNIGDIMKYMPHRYPFLLIDRIISMTKAKQITVIKNVTINEPFFTGHFPGYPVMPGVLIIEAMAQAAGVLLILTNGGRKDNELYFFASINNAKFKRQVIPGDTLRIDVKFIKEMRGISKYLAKVYVDESVAAEAELMIAKKGCLERVLSCFGIYFNRLDIKYDS